MPRFTGWRKGGSFDALWATLVTRHTPFSPSGPHDMGNATLFGLSPDDWKNLASFFVTPAVALAAVYVFGIDLVKIPFVQTEVPYKLSTRTVSFLAILLCFFSSLATAIWLTLRVFPGPKPAVDKFLEQFFRPLTSDEIAWAASLEGKKISSANFLLTSYDGRSDLRVFVNNHRVFGTHVDCVWQYQCREPANETTTQEEVIAKSKGMTLDHLFDANASSNLPAVNQLPISRDFMSDLHSGINYIDIFSNNSGFVGCRVEFSVEFVTDAGQHYAHAFGIRDSTLTTVPYRTIPEERTFSTCDQIRIPAKITL
jgi:hypothetical protein